MLDVARVAALASGQGGLRRGLKQRRRTTLLFSDATILTETPPLRAGWAPRGRQATVPITGNRAKRVLYGALSIRAGRLLLDPAARWNQDSFQAHLRHIRRVWRGWRIVLFLDRGSPHTAIKSRALAKALGIALRFLPTACPELNPLEGLWRLAKGQTSTSRWSVSAATWSRCGLGNGSKPLVYSPRTSGYRLNTGSPATRPHRRRCRTCRPSG
jgi:transposase